MSEIKGLWLMNFQTFYIQIWSLDKTFIKPDYINLFHSLYPGRMRVNMFSANAGIVFYARKCLKSTQVFILMPIVLRQFLRVWKRFFTVISFPYLVLAGVIVCVFSNGWESLFSPRSLRLVSSASLNPLHWRYSYLTWPQCSGKGISNFCSLQKFPLSLRFWPLSTMAKF